MIKSFLKKFLFLFLFFLISCTSEPTIKKPEKIQSLNKLYYLAYYYIDKGQISDAINTFSKIEKHYSYTDWAPNALSMIIYLYYDVSEYLESMENIKRFKNFYPNNKLISYVEYILALCLFEQVEVVSRDQTNTKLAKKQFKNIIDRFPKSEYAQDAYLKIDLLNEQLAGNEMFIARHYIERKKWTAAMKRLLNVYENYSRTIFIDEALHRLVEINYKLGNLNEAKKYASILGYNSNSSDWYKKSYKIIGDRNYIIKNKNNKKKFKQKILEMFKFK